MGADQLFVHGYFRQIAFEKFKIDIPSEIIDFVMMYLLKIFMFAPIDEHCPKQDGWHVYEDKDGVIWDTMLHQTNMFTVTNSNKFYVLHVLEQDDKKEYYEQFEQILIRNITSNSNKFQILQILQRDDEKAHFVHFR